MKLKFELTNEQRKYLGLISVEEDWELVKLDYKYEDIYFYFDEDIIRKKISLSENSYYETELNEKTTENRTVILPKTARGKIKKFNFTATQSFSPFGTYFSFSKDSVLIANYITQRTYYSESFMKNKNITIDDLKKWLDKWVKESTREDLKEIEELTKTNKNIGIDLGIKEFATMSDCTKIENLKLSKKYEKKLKREQRKLSRRCKLAKDSNKKISDNKNYQ